MDKPHSTAPGASPGAGDMSANGRRLSPRKHDAILAAAEACFCEGGFGISMDVVATSAGVSKQTVYHHFGSKDALFEAVVRAITERIRAPLLHDDAARRPPRDTLLAFGRGALDLMLDAQGLALMRLLIADAPRTDDLKQAVMSAGVEPMTEGLAEYLSAETRRGRLAVDDARHAAVMLMGMLAADWRIRALLGVLPDPTPEMRDAHVRAVVDTFLRAFGVGKG